MALKPDRVELLTDISYFMNTTATRGRIVAHSTGGSGAAMDDSGAVVAVPTTVSGSIPAGLLLNDVVNLDLTRQHINFHQDEVQQGGKVTLLRRGYVVTNCVSGTPTIGADAYYNLAGELTTTNSNSTKVGKFMSLTDADGYVKVDINIV